VVKNSVLGKAVTVKSCRYFSHSCRRHCHRAWTQCHCQTHLGPESCSSVERNELAHFGSSDLVFWSFSVFSCETGWVQYKVICLVQHGISTDLHEVQCFLVCLSTRKKKHKPKRRYKGFLKKDSVSIKEGCVTEIAEA